MAISQTSRLTLNISAALLDTLDLSTVRDDLTKSYTIDIANGSGTGQGNQVFHDTRTVTTGATDTLDLSGVLLSAIRQSVTLTAIKMIIIKAAAANTTNLTIQRPASNGLVLFGAASGSITIGPGGLFVWSSPAAGLAVTGATGDLLDIVNSAGASATYDVILIGVQ